MKDERIVIARAVRSWSIGIAEVTLVWLPHYSKLSVEYRQVHTQTPFVSYAVPDHCVKHWLKVFICDQADLQEDSYFIIEEPTRQWEDVLMKLLNMPRPYHPFDDVMESVRLEYTNPGNAMILLPNEKMVSQLRHRYAELREHYNIHVRASTNEPGLKSLALDTLVIVGRNHPDWNVRGETFARGQLGISKHACVISLAPDVR